MTTATLQPETELRRDDLRLAELVGFLAGYPTLDALEVIQAHDDPDPLARVAHALDSSRSTATTSRRQAIR